MTDHSTAPRPNILFINTDQQSASMMSCAGNPYIHTPAVDRLANEGIRFERAYCTHPVCLPSRFSWFTGRMPSELEIWHNKPKHLEKIPDRIMETTAGKLLKNSGYRVAYGGKTHLPADMEPETMGCEFITTDKRDGLAQTSADWIREHSTAQDGPFFLSVCFVNPHDICFMGMRDFIRTERGDAPDLNENERWLLSDGSDEMDELNAALKLPEGISEEEFFTKYCPPLPPNFIPQNEPESITAEVTKKGYKHFIREHWDERTWRLQQWAYGKLTERVDGQIGVILDALDDAGLADNTLVVFTSDHGEQAGAHQLDQKGYLYEESVRIPLLARWPERISKGKISEQLVSNGLDLVPTLCEVAKVDCPEELQGRSFLPIADGREEISPRTALPLETELGCGLVTNRFKYMRHNSGLNAEQLFDLVTDPYEMNNLSTTPDQQAVLEQFRMVYESHFSKKL